MQKVLHSGGVDGRKDGCVASGCDVPVPDLAVPGIGWCPGGVALIVKKSVEVSFGQAVADDVELLNG